MQIICAIINAYYSSFMSSTGGVILHFN